MPRLGCSDKASIGARPVMHHSVVGGDVDVIRPAAALEVLHSAYPPYAQSRMINLLGGRGSLCLARAKTEPRPTDRPGLLDVAGRSWKC
jgi:hypothetical protein